MSEQKTLSTEKKILRTFAVLLVLAGICALVYFILRWTGALEYINSVDKIRSLILSLGFWGRLFFVFIQFLQVTFLPLPSTVSTLAGVLIYGPLEAALLSIAGILIGSVLAFWLGRKFGTKLVTFMVGKETCKKWTKFLSNGKYSFFLMMLLPVFPDDVLCLVAGLTTMSWTFFVVTNLISRPIGVFMTCYLGSGHIIPYHGWGLVAWAVIGVVVILALVLSYVYRTQIENFMLRLSEKLSIKNKKHKDATEKEEKSENLDQKDTKNAEKTEKIDKKIVKNAKKTEKKQKNQRKQEKTFPDAKADDLPQDQKKVNLSGQ